MKISSLKFAIVSADSFCGPMRAGGGDFCMYDWSRMFEICYHYSASYLSNNFSELDKYDLVFLTGHTGYLPNCKFIAENTKAKTIWFPEGDVSLYNDRFNFDAYIGSWDACSMIGIVEEDKIPFYQALTKSKVFFMHVPIQEDLINGLFYKDLSQKNNDILIYGDNNPNNPVVAFAVAKLLNKPISTTVIPEEAINFIKNRYNISVSRASGKISQIEYLANWVSNSRVMLYPTRWIGTARQNISGAMCGTPVVGNRDSHTQKRLFPKLGTYIYDIEGMCELVNRLYEDPVFYKENVDYAREAVKFYSEENALNRLLQAYEETKGA